MEKQKIFYIINFGYFIRCLPFYEKDAASGLLKWGNSHRILQWKIVSIIHLLLRFIGVGGIGLWYDLTTSNLNWHQRVQYYGMASAVAITTCLQIRILIFSERIWSSQNTFFTFESKLSKIHNLDTNRTAINLYLNIMILLIIPTYLMFYPVLCFGIHFNIHMLTLFNTGYWMISLLLGTTIGLIGLVDLVVMLYYTSIALMYFCTMSSCLWLSEWKPSIIYTKNRKQELITHYKAFYMFHYLFMQDVKILLSILLTMIPGLMIFCIFGTIQYYEVLDTLTVVLLIGTLFVAFIFLTILLKLTSGVTVLSKNFIESFIRNDLSLRKVERLHLKSCSPLYVPVGSFFNITRKTWPTLLREVVLEIVIDLLVAFR